ncbi:MAG: hypothetical protein DI569_12875 [Sphingopyxis macrogoltabida]|uniref:Uncharacterized protein n=1 Tax=Sphingopyxis macrogoltabida TaxID=33050 RepID=A0A2W5MTW2_SPHMC|nr:MAG: hypothetical protein DI569_12875 [Sphingopyxis macrogoltabida]
MDLFGPDMKCLACGQEHTGARIVVLADGTQVSNYSEEWRRECEARSILRLPTLWDRKRRLERLEKSRGKPAVDQLRAAMMIIWKAAQERAREPV